MIDLDVLEPYYHIEDAPNRAPLFIAEGGAIRRDLKLTKFGVPVQIASREELSAQGRPYFEFTRLHIRGDYADVEFAYTVEGIRGIARMRRSGEQWAVDTTSLHEY